MRPMPVLKCLTVAGLLLWGSAPALADARPDLWQALRDGRAVALLRHALAPGTGDPPGFRLDDCTTQRNLSPDGRAQARGIGANFRAHGIDEARVYSSEWCRCLETARLLDLGPVEALPALNSFFGDRTRADPQSAAVKALLAVREGAGPAVLVTHQVNITALTGIVPDSGEIVVAEPQAAGELLVLGRIAPPD